MLSAEVIKIIVDGFEICEIMYQENGQGHGRTYRNDKLLYDGYWFKAYEVYKNEIKRVYDIWHKSGQKILIKKIN